MCVVGDRQQHAERVDAAAIHSDERLLIGRVVAPPSIQASTSCWVASARVRSLSVSQVRKCAAVSMRTLAYLGAGYLRSILVHAGALDTQPEGLESLDRSRCCQVVPRGDGYALAPTNARMGAAALWCSAVDRPGDS